jgi:hypothetical protein
VQGWNVVDTAVRKFGGQIPDLKTFNDPSQSVRAFVEFQKIMGNPNPSEDVARAVKWADACVKPFLRALSAKVQKMNAEQAQPTKGKSRGPRVPERFREGMKGSKQPAFRTNQDIFSADVLAGAINQRL